MAATTRLIAVCLTVLLLGCPRREINNITPPTPGTAPLPAINPCDGAYAAAGGGLPYRIAVGARPTGRRVYFGNHQAMSYVDWTGTSSGSPVSLGDGITHVCVVPTSSDDHILLFVRGSAFWQLGTDGSLTKLVDLATGVVGVPALVRSADEDPVLFYCDEAGLWRMVRHQQSWAGPVRLVEGRCYVDDAVLGRDRRLQVYFRDPLRNLERIVETSPASLEFQGVESIGMEPFTGGLAVGIRPDGFADVMFTKPTERSENPSDWQWVTLHRTGELGGGAWAPPERLADGCTTFVPRPGRSGPLEFLCLAHANDADSADLVMAGYDAARQQPWRAFVQPAGATVTTPVLRVRAAAFGPDQRDLYVVWPDGGIAEMLEGTTGSQPYGGVFAAPTEVLPAQQPSTLPEPVPPEPTEDAFQLGFTVNNFAHVTLQVCLMTDLAFHNVSTSEPGTTSNFSPEYLLYYATFGFQVQPMVLGGFIAPYTASGAGDCSRAFPYGAYISTVFPVPLSTARVEVSCRGNDDAVFCKFD